jgi:O-antigen/teichoic acid export membrane protein
MRGQSQHDRKLIRSSAWNALSYGGSQAVTFLVMIVLAHLLVPHEFGLVTLASLPLLALSYVQESGLTTAVIRQRVDLRVAAGTQLVFALCSAVVLYIASFAVAPLVAHVFSQPELTKVFRVLALTLILRGALAAPGAVLERELAFDKRAKGDVAGMLVQSVLSVGLAAAGFGVWSLVAGQLVNQLVVCVYCWLVVPFRPSPRDASWPMFRELSRYGRHVATSNVLLIVNDNADNAVIGRLLGATSVGVYNLAWRLANLPAIEISVIFGRATFAVYSSVREDIAEFRSLFLSTLRRTSFVSIPVAIGIIVAADPLVVGIFGERWHAAASPLQILAILGVSRTLSGITAPVFQASGRPQLNYQIGLWHLAVLIGSLYALAPPYGIRGVAWAEICASIASTIPCFFFVVRILDVQVRDVLLSLAKPCVSAAAVALVLLAARSALSLPDAATLAVLIFVGSAVYAATMLTLGRAELRTIVSAFRPEPRAEV